MLANLDLTKRAVACLVGMGVLLYVPAVVQAQIPNYSLRTILPAYGCEGIDLSPDGTTVYARKNFGSTNDDGFIVYDTQTHQMLTEYRVAGVPWHGLVSADGQYLWSGIYYGGYVKKLDADTGSVITTIDVGSWVGGLAFDSQRRYIYAGENDPGTGQVGSIQRVDTVTEAVVGSATLNGEPAAAIYVDPNDEYVYALSRNPDSERLHKIRTSDMGIEETHDVPGIGEPGWSLSPDGSTAYIPEASGHVVHVIDLLTMTEAGTLAIESPSGFFVSPDGTHALTMLLGTSPEPDYVRVFDLSTESVEQSISLGDHDLRESRAFRRPVCWDWDAGLNAVYISVRGSDGGVAVLVPEPSTVALLGIGAAGLAGYACRKTRCRGRGGVPVLLKFLRRCRR